MNINRIFILLNVLNVTHLVLSVKELEFRNVLNAKIRKNINQFQVIAYRKIHKLINILILVLKFKKNASLLVKIVLILPVYVLNVKKGFYITFSKKIYFFVQINALQASFLNKILLLHQFSAFCKKIKIRTSNRIKKKKSYYKNVNSVLFFQKTIHVKTVLKNV